MALAMTQNANNHVVIEFVTVTRGGSDGLIAVVEVDAETKYFEVLGLQSMLKTYTTPDQQLQLQQAMTALQSIDNLDDIAEFEGGLPVQGSLF